MKGYVKMRINSIDNQSFGAAKFSLPLRSYKCCHLGEKRIVNQICQYDNPNAQALFDKAMNEKDINKKMALLEQMGDFHIVDTNLTKALNAVSKKLSK